LSLMETQRTTSPERGQLRSLFRGDIISRNTQRYQVRKFTRPLDLTSNPLHRQIFNNPQDVAKNDRPGGWGRI
jgi:hypothetical protein